MSKPIPPLLSSTPPPIDSNDYSFGSYEAPKGEYDGIAYNVSPQHKTKSMDDISDLPSLPSELEHSMYVMENEKVDKSVEHQSSHEITKEATENLCGTTIFNSNLVVSYEKESHLQESLDLPNNNNLNEKEIAHKNNSIECLKFQANNSEISITGEFDYRSDADYDDNIKFPSVTSDDITEIKQSIHDSDKHLNSINKIIFKNDDSVKEVNQESIKNYNMENIFSPLTEHGYVNNIINEIDKNIDHSGNGNPIVSQFVTNEGVSEKFEADFSQLETNVLITPLNIQSNNSSKYVNEDIEEITDEYGINDNENFEDFQGFQGCCTDENELHEDSTKNLDEKVKLTLNMMFPAFKTGNFISEYEVKSTVESKIWGTRIKFDTATALDHQWNNSTTKQSLMKSLGMDSRNILCGDSWNSMSRFASALLFSPLEPLQPTKINEKPVQLAFQQEGILTEDIGKNEEGLPDIKLCLNCTKYPNNFKGGKVFQNEADTSIVDIQSDYKCDISKPTEICVRSDNFGVNHITDDMENKAIRHQISSENLEKDQNSYREINKSSFDKSQIFSIPLKETHICSHSDERENLSDNMKVDSIDFDFKIASTGIIIDEKVVKKEYRDIEYDPKNRDRQSFSGAIGLERSYKFNDFMSANYFGDLEKNSLKQNESEQKTFLSNNSTKLMINCDEGSNKLYSEINFVPPMLVVSQNDAKEVGGVVPKSQIISKNNYSSLDDDFNDFQFVPLEHTSSMNYKRENITSGVKKNLQDFSETTLRDEMILSPVVLLPQAVKIKGDPKIEWPQPGMNSEELAKIEEIFMQPKIEELNNADLLKVSRTEDEGWSDFISVSVNNAASMPPEDKFLNKSHSLVKVVSAQNPDEDWTDFVSNVTTHEDFSVNFNKGNYESEEMKTTFVNLNNLSSNIANKTLQDCKTNNNTDLYSVQDKSPTFQCHSNDYLSKRRDQSEKISNLQGHFYNSTNISHVPDLTFVIPRNISSKTKPNCSKK